MTVTAVPTSGALNAYTVSTSHAVSNRDAAQTLERLFAHLEAVQIIATQFFRIEHVPAVRERLIGIYRQDINDPEQHGRLLRILSEDVAALTRHYAQFSRLNLPAAERDQIREKVAQIPDLRGVLSLLHTASGRTPT